MVLPQADGGQCSTLPGVFQVSYFPRGTRSGLARQLSRRMMIKGLRIGWRGISSIWLLAKLS